MAVEMSHVRRGGRPCVVGRGEGLHLSTAPDMKELALSEPTTVPRVKAVQFQLRDSLPVPHAVRTYE
jgi:hypothetical protein